MNIYEVVFSFLDPSRAMHQVIADSPEEAVEKIKADIDDNLSHIGDITVESVTEILNHPMEAKDISSDRSLN
ncbi:MAG: hypothetical protein ACR652_13480 [Methylocystis sp.]|uniref:hypothetical protein n=1 Tax=Methylocystis sp. TaxID=1911079 RepID=UPI003DA42883